MSSEKSRSSRRFYYSALPFPCSWGQSAEPLTLCILNVSFVEQLHGDFSSRGGGTESVLNVKWTISLRVWVLKKLQKVKCKIGTSWQTGRLLVECWGQNMIRMGSIKHNSIATLIGGCSNSRKCRRYRDRAAAKWLSIYSAFLCHSPAVQGEVLPLWRWRHKKHHQQVGLSAGQLSLDPTEVQLRQPDSGATLMPMTMQGEKNLVKADTISKTKIKVIFLVACYFSTISHSSFCPL